MRPVDLERYSIEQRVLHDVREVESGRYIGTLPISGGPDMYIYANLRRADVLRVQFHGAFLPTDTYPRFDRVGSSEASGDAYLSLADPTIAVDEAVTLGWYLGGADWDPLDVICKLIRRAARVSGAAKIVLIGGSGGGFAALRAGLRIPGALVYCFNPQTAVLNYYGGHIERYFSHLHGPDVSPDEVVARDPQRFDLVTAYGEAPATPAVFYSQNLTDGFHIERHYLPFKRTLGVVSSAQGPSSLVPGVYFHLFDGERQGHKPPNVAEFNVQYESAMQWLATTRGARNGGVAPAPADEKQWTQLFDEISRIRRELAAIQSGESSWSLRRHIVSDLMGVMAMREEPVDRRPVLSGWAMSPVALRHVLGLVEDAPDGSRIVEFGSGASTVWIADAVAKRGAGVSFTSFEHDEAYCERTKKQLYNASLGDYVELRLSSLEAVELDGEARPWYSGWSGSLDVSVVVVDGPPGGLRPMARFPAISFIESRVVDRGVVIVDDYTRADEKSMVERWNEFSEVVRLEHIETVDRAGVFRAIRV